MVFGAIDRNQSKTYSILILCCLHLNFGLAFSLVLVFYALDETSGEWDLLD